LVLSLFGLEQKRNASADVLEYFKTMMELLFSSEIVHGISFHN